MKNNAFFVLALLAGTAATAQTSTDTTVAVTTTVNTSQYLSADLSGLTSETLRPEHAFPILGSYKAEGATTGVTIVPDETNKGIVWIEGLPQGRFKALMKKAPATYKIPAQKTESGKAVAEGTLFYNPASKEVKIVLGRPFNDTDPTGFMTATTKQKVKTWQYTGVKTDVAAVPQQAQQ